MFEVEKCFMYYVQVRVSLQELCTSYQAGNCCSYNSGGLALTCKLVKLQGLVNEEAYFASFARELPDHGVRFQVHQARAG